jgi:AcrR family transcriptional regulator
VAASKRARSITSDAARRAPCCTVVSLVLSPGGVVPVKPSSTVSEKIIERTIYLIGRKGTTDVPVREIARAAGVNVAAINYYFDSKEQMLQVVEERFIADAATVLGKVYDTRTPPEQRLLAWADEVMQYLLDYPGILLLIDRKMSAQLPDEFGASLQRLFERGLVDLKALVGEVIGSDDDEELSYKVTVLISVIAQPAAVFLGSVFDKEALLDADRRRRFLRLVLEMLKR